jgi:hypothetical protein
MTELRHTMKSLSLAAGLGETGVRDMLKRTQSPSIDAVAKVARALDMTLSALYEGQQDEALLKARICSVDLVGASTVGTSAWSELTGKHSILIDESRGRPIHVENSTNLVAIYHLDAIAVFEKVKLESIGSGEEYLILMKDKKRYLGIINAEIEGGEKFILSLVLTQGELRLPVSDIDWIAERKQTIPRLQP